MKKHTTASHKLSLALAAALALVLGMSFAHAAVPLTSSGDLIFGIRVTGGTGNGTDYEASLGNFSLFTSPSTTPLDLSSRIDLTTIAATYGATWYNRSDLFWSVSGTSNGTVIFGSSVNAAGTTTGQSTAYKQETISNQSSTAGTQMSQQQLGLGVQPNANGGTPYSALVSTLDTQCLTRTIAGQSGTFTSPYNAPTAMLFGQPGVAPFEHNNNGAVGYSDLYRLAGVTKGTGNGQLLGTFVLTTDGSTPSLQYGILPLEIPEPSTYAHLVLGLGLVGGIVFFRRFRRSKVKA